MIAFIRRLLRRRGSKAASTPLSDFMRNASSGEKKKVYVKALKQASAEQNAVIERQRSRRADACRA
jgi:uncharacterized FlgJ-related protein